MSNFVDTDYLKDPTHFIDGIKDIDTSDYDVEIVAKLKYAWTQSGEMRFDLVEGTPLVRCKDCRKWQTINCPFYNKYTTVMPNGEQFCSLGERKEE